MNKELITDTAANLDALRSIAQDIDELNPILTSVVANDTAILDALSQLLRTLQQMQRRSEESQLRVAEELRSARLELSRIYAELSGESNPVIISAAQAQENPEIALLEYLYAFLPNKTAIDIGAHCGDVSERLLNAGYTVFAFEPYQPSFQTMLNKLGQKKEFHGFEWAIGPEDAKMALRVAENLSEHDKRDPSLFNSLLDHPMLTDCKFGKSITVTVRSLKSLRDKGDIPKTAGLLKIDTEGFDIEIIKSLEKEETFSVVMAEYWDSDHPFGKAGNGKLSDIVVALKERGYAFHLVIYHQDETSTISYYCNLAETMPKSWGNVLFFKDRTLFLEALRWCRGCLLAK